MKILLSSFFHIISTYYTYRKILSYRNSHHPPMISCIISLTIIFIFSIITQLHTPYIFSIIFILFFSICMSIIDNIRIELAIIATIFSHSIFRIMCTISSFVITIISIPFYYLNQSLPNNLLVFFTGLSASSLIYLFFKIKRLKSGMPFLSNPTIVKTGISICIIVIILKFFDSLFLYNSSFVSSLPVALATILLAPLLFIWWRKQITKSYIEKLRKLEVQSLYNELEEKERLILKLTADNQSLSRIIHKDNKLIPAMEHALTDFLRYSNFSDPEKLKQYGNELARNLQDMAQDRQGILVSYENEGNKLKLTGHVGIDAILVYMNKKAMDNHIIFECKHSPENLKYLLSKISEEDLTHLLSDLLENALIAMREEKNGKLVVVFGKFQKEAYISVADNGISFDINTLHSLGLRPHTTHAESGGSGIGLMDIWNLKKKYRATIQIQEFEKTDMGFSKNILFSFNSKNHYVIQSYRHTEITNTQTRSDLYVIPTNKNKKNEEKTA